MGQLESRMTAEYSSSHHSLPDLLKLFDHSRSSSLFIENDTTIPSHKLHKKIHTKVYSSMDLKSLAFLPKKKLMLVKRHSSNGVFSILPDEINLTLLHFMDIPMLAKMSQLSKYWYDLCQDDSIYQRLLLSKFKIHPSRFSILLQNEYENLHKWKEMYIQYDSALTTWSGFALDPITNGNKPYSMQLILKDIVHKRVLGISQALKRRNIIGLKESDAYRVSEFQGCCRWMDLNDALTRVEGVFIDSLGVKCVRFVHDSFLENHIPRFITFNELQVIRGEDLAVPNRYSGVMIGNTLLGIYDPGHPSLVGSFGIVMEDSLPFLMAEEFEFKKGDLYKGMLIHTPKCIFESIHETSIYMKMVIESVKCDSFIAYVQLYPSHHCQTTMRPFVSNNQTNCYALKMTASFIKTRNTLSNTWNYDFKNVTFTPNECFNRQEILMGLWADEHLPLYENIRLEVKGNAIIGLYSLPKAGCFVLNRF